MPIDDHTLPKMPEAQIHQQPPDVWRAVEYRILHEGWQGRVKQMLQGEGYNGGHWLSGNPEPGWLTWPRAEKLEAVDVPIRQLFWAVALAQRIG